MSGYESDSSLSDAGDDTSTSVLLGYASRKPTEDTVSHLGGKPTWFANAHEPTALLAKCRVCHDYLALLLQLNGDLPDHFPLHERRLFVWSCRRRTCRRKQGSVRAFRSTRVNKSTGDQGEPVGPISEPQAQPKAQQNLGAMLFGSGSQTGSASTASANPFSSNKPSNPSSNPFSGAPGPLSSLAAKPPQKPKSSAETTAEQQNLSSTFASKLKVSLEEEASNREPKIKEEHVSWPSDSALAKPFPQFYLDAEQEYLSSTYSIDGNGNASSSAATQANYSALMDVDGGESGGANSSNKEDKMLYEDAHDKTFQRFADRLAQNPEQVLRYEFGGSPLLYSRSDAVGRIFAGRTAGDAAKVQTVAAAGSKPPIPRCGNCGAARVFELQLVPHAIAELEADEEAATLMGEGMEWGTILLGVCEKDCIPAGVEDVGYVEEWVGVQWEEVVQRSKP